MSLSKYERDHLIQYTLDDFMLAFNSVDKPQILEVTEVEGLRLMWKVRTVTLPNFLTTFYVSIPSDGPAEAFLPAADTARLLIYIMRHLLNTHEAEYPHSIGL